jgi:uncharacterized membrane protein YfcA
MARLWSFTEPCDAGQPSISEPRLQGYFLPASIIGMTGYLLAGLWTSAVTHYYLLSLPITLVGVFLGRVINHRLRGESFLRYIYLGLAAIGVLLVLQAITDRL